ncbi:MAG TPA: SAM-dependent methyltransferase [Cyanobacteria bacterium UBA8803]|nr:SAM-dependent methyltransferase [Cyanobacteria bacterium UBA9273]HBL61165.1 SAM-dependent methyltransferase [Cyanobacteria bacterium UBA8803]
MKLKRLQKNWDELGRRDPFWSILSDPTKKGNKWHPDEFFKTGEAEIAALLKSIESFGISLSYKRALDFGCGAGRLTQALSCYFDECYGVDIAPSMIELARKSNRHGNKCQYYLNEGSDLSLFKDNYFNLIYSNIVLQHISPEYSKNYIKEFLRVLNPGGLLAFQIPSELAPVESINALADSAYRAEITIEEASLIAKSASEVAVKVKIKNISDTIWPSFQESQGKYQINLGNHWLDQRGKPVANDDGRTPLPKNVKPMEEVEMLLNATVPIEPGTYLMELDMVHEQVTWFKDKGSQTAKIMVRVENASKLKGITDKMGHFYRSFSSFFQPPSSSPFLVPSMEMYGIPQNIIMELLETSGGKVLDVQPDNSAGSGWLSFLYYVTK